MAGSVLYHVTLQSELASIRERGLVPQIGPRSKKCNEAIPAVYLFPTLEDVEDALTNWLGEEYPEEAALAILQVELPSTLESTMKSGAGYEVVVRHLIPPSSIVGFFDEAMKPLN